ncbi:hypothetical protein Pelo_13587 [Pelomyxa schiedti]|nr:hypothetical protein Pelo_13587 [Pelomyxa schiedti]
MSSASAPNLRLVQLLNSVGASAVKLGPYEVMLNPPINSYYIRMHPEGDPHWGNILMPLRTAKVPGIVGVRMGGLGRMLCELFTPELIVPGGKEFAFHSFELLITAPPGGVDKQVIDVDATVVEWSCPTSLLSPGVQYLCGTFLPTGLGKSLLFRADISKCPPGGIIRSLLPSGTLSELHFTTKTNTEIKINGTLDIAPVDPLLIPRRAKKMTLESIAGVICARDADIDRAIDSVRAIQQALGFVSVEFPVPAFIFDGTERFLLACKEVGQDSESLCCSTAEKGENYIYIGVNSGLFEAKLYLDEDFLTGDEVPFQHFQFSFNDRKIQLLSVGKSSTVFQERFPSSNLKALGTFTTTRGATVQLQGRQSEALQVDIPADTASPVTVNIGPSLGSVEIPKLPSTASLSQVAFHLSTH